MRQIDNIMKLMQGELTDNQKDHLHTVLETILAPSKCNLTNEELIDRFISNKRFVGRSKRTLEQYLDELLVLNNVMESMSFLDMTTDSIRDYFVKYQSNHNINRKTTLNKVRYLNSFFTFLTKEGYIDRNPIDGIESIKIEKKIRSILSPEDMENLRCACNTPRDRAIVEFLYSTGVRISELIGIKIGDIDFYKKEVKVYGKGDKERIVYFDEITKFYLDKYLRGANYPSEYPLFSQYKNPAIPLSDRTIQQFLSKLGKESGVHHVHPHKFRRTMATNLLNKGMPVECIKEILGHSSLDTTMIYCNVSKENVKSNYMKLN